jgi:hypothetical protein
LCDILTFLGDFFDILGDFLTETSGRTDQTNGCADAKQADAGFDCIVADKQMSKGLDQ